MRLNSSLEGEATVSTKKLSLIIVLLILKINENKGFD
jgi:hypothetical protein